MAVGVSIVGLYISALSCECMMYAKYHTRDVIFVRIITKWNKDTQVSTGTAYILRPNDF